MSLPKNAEKINDIQTTEFRQFKYKQLTEAGFTHQQARKIRDWKTVAVVRQLAAIHKKSWHDANFDFYRNLKDTGITPFKK